MSKEQKITTDIKVPNKDLEALKINFPQCFDKDGNFQLEKFKNNLTEKEINFSTESYGLDWLGKSYARLLASDPATTLLKADETHNSKPENANSENLLIKGDNLEVLKHLSNTYYEQVKMIYIDPPYNTGGDGFLYKDDRKFTVKELQQLIGVDEEKAKRILDFTQQKSNSHSAWLTFMYPRLYIAKQLLKDDGVIFISIDDSEVATLKMLLDNEIFGEENFVAQLPTIMNLKGNNDEFGFAGTHEYTLVYSKNKFKTTLNQFNVSDDDLEDWTEDEVGFYKQGANLKATGTNAPRAKRPNLYYPIFIDSDNTVYVTEDDNPPKKFTGELTTIYPITNEQEMSWRWSKDKVKNEPNNIIVSRNGNIGIYKKQRPSLGDLPSKKPKTIFYKAEYSSGNGTAQIKSLLGDKYFANPKPIDLIKDLILIGSSSDDIVLDFFAGSGTTADAMMQLNVENIEKRKFILAQLPEPIDPKKDKDAFDFVKNELKIDNPTIYEITKERIIRASKKHLISVESKKSEKIKEIKELESKLDLDDKEEKIKQLNAEIKSLKQQDLGFKIFETTPIWEDYDFESTELDNQTKLFDESKLTEDDIKALLITWKTYDGIALTQELEMVDLSGYTAYYGNGKLYLMNKGFTTDNLKNLLEKIDSDKKFNPTSIITFGYHFDSKNLRELSENVKSYANKKNIDIDFITRY
ncbi:site-specific DNA-methyltransferase [Flavobacterium azooxidireducens]|uniref:site-specific DNA-methyltransferase (adenine-specific) n=1 Tax=Flavobacterium azooxidireducens TaxID=1871076 RepID=A0ABY4KCH0_9FLAO|nr:site-specific DNA-methyltransferase [Flavobacterium azooxidireducens]UPQ78481.1 site-specific DNA-methyltransferase [Flavobacterium azooxidireducens]